ncbi:MAG TPA: hypothetical protein DCG34_03115 [Clostridiales bacterium]|nr:hypothetical protein [Clostridiales bacterium]
MMTNIIEALRQESVAKLFTGKVFFRSFETWKGEINSITPNKTSRQVIDLGDHLSEIFRTTRTAGRGQGDVSGGGAAWESIVCWYLNLCSIGRRSVAIKHSRALIPDPICDAITVNYRNFVSNTESDLIVIVFPDKPEYQIDKELIHVNDANGRPVPLFSQGRNPKYNLKAVLNALCHRDFSEIEIHIIQCKTNWNDNAQIPMLWDMIYSATNFRNNVTIGRNGYSIANIAQFSYSFVTVPTSRITSITPNSTCVKRVSNISGGNYWGRPTQNNVASSIKEMLLRNLSRGHGQNFLTTLQTELQRLNTEYTFFGLS